MAGLEFRALGMIYSNPRPHPRPSLSAYTVTPSSSKLALTARPLNGPTDAMSTDVTIKRHGRQYLRDPTLPYPLPVDLPEMHRQSLRTIMLMRVFGAPFCAPCFEDETPTKVLELCCGSALWSSACNDYFKRSGSKVSFTGLDIAPLAPDLNRSGLDWTFVQHDTRKRLPFPDEEFDFIFIKDASICTSASVFQADPLGEPLRLLRSGGVLEVWDSDYLLRTLLPNPPVARGTSEDDLEQAQATGTYTISAATPFAQAQNQYLKDYNSWAQKALEKCRITTTPCASISLAFSAEADSFQDYGSRRIAIPLSEVRWEREPGATLATSKRRVSTPGTGEYRKCFL